MVLRSSARVTCHDDQENGGLAAAAAADVAVVVLAQTSREGQDRTSLDLVQSNLVAKIAEVQQRTIVVTISPGPFLTPWRDLVSAILDIGLSGEQSAPALASVLYGDQAPAGKLPHTLPNKWNESMMTERQYPGVPPAADAPRHCQRDPDPNPAPCTPTRAFYSEKLHVGYRWYDAQQLKPAFAFGHGLSYTTFAYAGLRVAGRNLSFAVENSGRRAGGEVAQLYVRYPPSAAEPFRQLRGFRKVVLAPGESAEISFELLDRWLSIWDVSTHAWQLVRGDFDVFIGSSSSDVRLQTQLTV